MSKKRFVIKKYVIADNMTEAMLNEQSGSIEEVWVDNDYKPKELESAIGFHMDIDYNVANEIEQHGKQKSSKDR